MPIYRRLLWLSVVAITSSAIIMIAILSWSASRYQQEVVQSLNQGIAQYIIDHQKEPLIGKGGEVNSPALRALAMQSMMINPMVEVYLLDETGLILDHALHTDDILLESVELSPIKKFINYGENPSRQRVISGNDPRNPGQPKVFSAAPIDINGERKGYLYVVLSSQQWQVLSENIASSYVLQLFIVGLLIVFGLLLLLFFYGFYSISKPIRKLEKQVSNFHSAVSEDRYSLTVSRSNEQGNELSLLENAFSTMQERIESQIQELEQSDRLRRELISNISHDLRTPIASIQGYLETLILKGEGLSDTERNEYLSTALRHSVRLTRLIASLFELSKLDSAAITTEPEVFSITELASDVVQGFRLLAEDKNITIYFNENLQPALVKADIAMMERVFQNLVENAIRHTPKGGMIEIGIEADHQSVLISVSDTGSGIAAADIPYVFDRYYHSGAGSEPGRPVSGLGLAIVKRILELHDSIIEVSSELKKGTRFSFALSSA